MAKTVPAKPILTKNGGHFVNDRTAELHDDERIDTVNEDLKIIQKKKGLTFGTDAYLLAAFAKASKSGVCADFGAGTGIISLLTATRRKYPLIYAVELQEEFCDLIGRNAKLNGLEGAVIPILGDVREAKDLIGSERCDVILSNPPYMARSSGFAPESDFMTKARIEENGTVFDFCRSASQCLKWGGSFFTVFRPDRMPELFTALRENGLEPKRLITVYPRLSAPPCLILTEAKKGAKPSLRCARPLILSEEPDNAPTADCDRVYDEFSLEFLFG